MTLNYRETSKRTIIQGIPILNNLLLTVSLLSLANIAKINNIFFNSFFFLIFI